jgi:hypothetical protein
MVFEILIVRIDLPAHYGFASLPHAFVSTFEGGDAGSPLMALQKLNSKIGSLGEGGSPGSTMKLLCERGDSGALVLALHRLNSNIGGEGGPPL